MSANLVEDLTGVEPPERRAAGPGGVGPGHAGRGPGRAPAPARAAHPRPAGPADRRGRLPPRLPRADGHGVRARGARAGLDGQPARRPPGPGRAVVPVEPGGRGHRLPHRHGLRGGPGPAGHPRAGRLRRAGGPARLRPGLRAGRDQARGHRRVRHDREAGRLRPAGQRDRGPAAGPRPPGRGTALPAERAQVVLLGPDERRVLHRGPDRGRARLLLRAALAAGRHPQRLRHPAAQGQAGQPGQRVVGDRVPRRLRDRRGRRGPGRPDDPDVIGLHPAGLRGRLGRADPGRAVAGPALRRPPTRLRPAAVGAAGPGAGAGRPGPGMGGRGPPGLPAGPDHGPPRRRKRTAAGRILTPVAKYWNCKRAPLVAEEAIECIGGNGYIEEHPPPRDYREAPLNAIWEGTSNMMVLDVQRVLTREPKAIEPLLDEIRAAGPAEPRLAAAAAALEAAAATPDGAGRRLVSQIALAVQAALLVRYAPAAVADTFCATRLDGDWAPTFGTLPAAAEVAWIIGFARLG